MKQVVNTILKIILLISPVVFLYGAINLPDSIQLMMKTESMVDDLPTKLNEPSLLSLVSLLPSPILHILAIIGVIIYSISTLMLLWWVRLFVAKKLFKNVPSSLPPDENVQGTKKILTTESTVYSWISLLLILFITLSFLESTLS